MIKTPEDVGSSIFETLLSRISDTPEEISFGSTLYQGKGMGKKSLLPGDGDTVSPDLPETLDKKISRLFLSGDRFVLPESILPRLIHFLGKQGLSMKEINRVLLSIRNSDGSLQVDRLLAQLLSNESGVISQENSPVVPSSQIPRVEELLFKIGLGAGDVKEIIESSINKKGDLAFERFTSSLEKYYPGLDLESTLQSLFKKQGVTLNSQSRLKENHALSPELKNELIRTMKGPSPDFFREIKQNLAVLLREKGIPPQEVKSFLETMSVDFSKSLLKKSTDQAPEIHMLLNQAYVKDPSRWKKDGWHEKIMNILKDNNVFVSKNSDRSSFQGQEDIRLNLAELLKQGEPKAGNEYLLSLSADKKIIELEKAGTRADHGNRDVLIKDGPGADISLNKTNHDLKDAAVGKARNHYTLPQPLPKILDRMVWMMQSGEQRGRIRLHPPELGRLDLHLSIKNGHLQAHLGAESGMVKEIIEANLHQLKQQLQDQGLIVDRFEVMVGLEDGRHKEDSMWSWKEHKGSSSRKSAGKVSVRTEDAGPAEQSIDSPYQIDVHV